MSANPYLHVACTWLLPVRGAALRDKLEVEFGEVTLQARGEPDLASKLLWPQRRGLAVVDRGHGLTGHGRW